MLNIPVKEEWYPISVIDGFETMPKQCNANRAVKHKEKHKQGSVRRILNLNFLLQQSQWTSKSPKVKDQNLTIYIDLQYKHYLQTERKQKNYIGDIN